MKQEIMIFIDGENFFHALQRDFFQKEDRRFSLQEIKEDFDILEFSKYLARSNQDVLRGVYYYDALLGKQASISARIFQRKYFNRLQDEGIILRLGKVEFSRQKGTDVYLATDLLSLAWKRQYRLGVLLSNDKDFVPAIRALQQDHRDYKIAIQYAYTHQGYCAALANICARQMKLRRSEVMRFWAQAEIHKVSAWCRAMHEKILGRERKR